MPRGSDSTRETPPWLITLTVVLLAVRIAVRLALGAPEAPGLAPQLTVRPAGPAAPGSP